ncbi:MAG: hypothetical protein SFV21_14525 [Rhodospirillaceae bacterium]|nr:hypothetical protein [Rhodospirillaceae bacterium]
MKESLAIKITNKQVFHYAYDGVEMLSVGRDRDIFVIGGEEKIYFNQALECALMTVQIAALIGIQVGAPADQDSLPYSDLNEALVFAAPHISDLVGRDLYFLRGWKDFNSCVKGFNALGLIAEQVLRVQREFQAKPPAQKRALLIEFLESRRDAGGELSVRMDRVDIDALFGTDHELAALIWHTFADRKIVCSTSSNMGISLHDLIYLFRGRRIALGADSYTVFNRDEGALVIWAPDRRADFMNEEKAQHLAALESAEGSTTSVRTYINRKERDPGAINDALAAGGYFFPTNPQSKLELKGLLYTALASFLRGRTEVDDKIVKNENLRHLLHSLDVVIDEKSGKLVIQRGVEGGIYGLMIPYFILIEEMLAGGKPVDQGVDTWNQASIGAALAAATLAADSFKIIHRCEPRILALFARYFPRISQNWDRLAAVPQNVVGVFDLANIQSLAQLLGVVVQRHLSGKGTPFVGLGSSSYSNGNLCFDILMESANRRGAFKGKECFHPSTHTLNFISQALIFGEDVARARRVLHAKSEADAAAVLAHVRKPEPAGATALTGLLLSLLDQGELTVFELAYGVHRLGFSCELFLRFCGFEGAAGREKICNLAAEEGPYMGQFMTDFLNLLEWPTAALASYAARNRLKRGRAGSATSFPDKPLTVIYLTGDNTAQPGARIVGAQLDNLARLVAVDPTGPSS